jgi:hypothetical protein
MTAKKRLPNQTAKKGAGSRLPRKFLAVLGPGLITGAADDDPSGISTYSVAGAAYGYATLWIALLTFPLMVSIQLMCARLNFYPGGTLTHCSCQPSLDAHLSVLISRHIWTTSRGRERCRSVTRSALLRHKKFLAAETKRSYNSNTNDVALRAHRRI